MLRNRDTIESKKKKNVVPVILEIILQVTMMIRADDLKILMPSIFLNFFVHVQSMFTYISSFSAMMFDIHLPLKTNGYFLAYFKWKKLEEVIG